MRGEQWKWEKEMAGDFSVIVTSNLWKQLKKKEEAFCSNGIRI
jgi:hypothetical protein